MTAREVASKYAHFGYDPVTDTITSGPYVIHVDASLDAAKALARTIYQAAREVDPRSAAELKSRTVEAVSAAGLPNASLRIS
ncbi:hypothetical protein [Amycolatopsis sp. NPDC001319]|uniref:hypothetical protein n=1 Tax=unclassified Amycolatopsis TaxID=2618356 RepID=UPI0036D144C1